MSDTAQNAKTFLYQGNRLEFSLNSFQESIKEKLRMI